MGLDVHEPVLNLWREQAIDISKASQVAAQDAVGSQLGMHLPDLHFGLLCMWILQELYLLVVSLSMVDYFGPVFEALVGTQRTCRECCRCTVSGADLVLVEGRVIVSQAATSLAEAWTMKAAWTTIVRSWTNSAARHGHQISCLEWREDALAICTSQQGHSWASAVFDAAHMALAPGSVPRIHLRRGIGQMRWIRSISSHSIVQVLLCPAVSASRNTVSDSVGTTSKGLIPEMPCANMCPSAEDLLVI